MLGRPCCCSFSGARGRLLGLGTLTEGAVCPSRPLLERLLSGVPDVLWDWKPQSQEVDPSSRHHPEYFPPALCEASGLRACRQPAGADPTRHGLGAGTGDCHCSVESRPPREPPCADFPPEPPGVGTLLSENGFPATSLPPGVPDGAPSVPRGATSNK